MLHCVAGRSTNVALRTCRSSCRALTTTRGSRQSHPDIYDVVCIGGGPAGLALATALKAHKRTSSLKVALVDGQDLQGNQKSFKSSTAYSNRCSSLTPGSVNFLKDIGAWQHVDQTRVQPYHAMQVWDGVSGSSINFNPGKQVSDSLTNLIFPQPRPSQQQHSIVATMTENLNLTSALMSRVNDSAGLTLFENTRVSSIDAGEETSSLDLRSWPVVSLSPSTSTSTSTSTNSSNPKRLAARLLVGADGFNSPVRAYANIPSRGWDYDRHGVVATLSTEHVVNQHHRTAYQRFLPTGPVALLPLPNNTATLVWSTTPAHATKLKCPPPADLVAMVNAAFRLLPDDIEYLLGADMPDAGQADEVSWREPATSLDLSSLPPRVLSVLQDSVASFPLRMRHADSYVGARVALVGDAAHTMHPLAGQGLNAGLADVVALVDTIDQALMAGMDVGASFALEGYNARQWGRNHLLLGVVDKLHKLYSVAGGPLVWARSLGLDLVDKAGFAKRLLMESAAG